MSPVFLVVRTLRRPNIESDRYLVAAKIRTHLYAGKNAKEISKFKKISKKQGNFDVEKLQSQQTTEELSTRLALGRSASER